MELDMILYCMHQDINYLFVCMTYAGYNIMHHMMPIITCMLLVALQWYEKARLHKILRDRTDTLSNLIISDPWIIPINITKILNNNYYSMR